MNSFSSTKCIFNNKTKINFGASVTGCYYPAIANTDSLVFIGKEYYIKKNLKK